MFLVETVKRVIKNLPEVEEPEEGWYQWLIDMDDTNPASRNYDPCEDPADPACPLYEG